MATFEFQACLQIWKSTTDGTILFVTSRTRSVPVDSPYGRLLETISAQQAADTDLVGAALRRAVLVGQDAYQNGLYPKGLWEQPDITVLPTERTFEKSHVSITVLVDANNLIELRPEVRELSGMGNFIRPFITLMLDDSDLKLGAAALDALERSKRR